MLYSILIFNLVMMFENNCKASNYSKNFICLYLFPLGTMIINSFGIIDVVDDIHPPLYALYESRKSKKHL